MISKKDLEDLREKYPGGCRVRLTKMEDPQAPKIGEMGTCRGVDDIGSYV